MTNRQHGWSLIEVLVAMAIFGIGLLGVAKLQMIGLHQTRSGYLRTQADRMAYDMLDRMRVNRDIAASGGYDMTMRAQPPSGGATTDCDTTACTPDETRDFDRRRWLANIRAMLPSGEGSISTTKHNSYSEVTVTVTWRKGTGANMTKRPSVTVRTML